MSVIFCDGFDWYQTADLLKRWTSMPGSSALAVDAAYARSSGGQGCYISGASGGTTTGNLHKSFGTNYAQGIIGFAMRWPSTTTVASRILLLVLDGTTEQISVRTNSSGVLTVTRGGTVLATGTTVLSADTWYYIEVKFTIHASTGAVELKLNGTAEIASVGSLDTNQSANAYWNAVGLLSSSSATPMHVDDLYVIDPTTGANTTFLGPVQVMARKPAANGATVAWTPNGGSNLGSVGEDYQDGTGTFVQSATANQVDTFVMQDAPIASGSLFAVAHHLVAVQDAGATRTVAPVIRISGTDYAGTGVALSTSMQMLTQMYDQSPATSSAWSLSEFNGAESGYKLVS